MKRPPAKRWVDGLIWANGFVAFFFYIILDIAVPVFFANTTPAAYPDIATIISIFAAYFDSKSVSSEKSQKIKNKELARKRSHLSRALQLHKQG
jgi:hypothetical protein